MTRTRSFRALAGVLAVWVGICLAQPMQLHLCVMHGGLSIESVGHADSHMSHGAVSHDAHHSTQSHDKSQQCSCLGDCTAGNAIALITPQQFRVAMVWVNGVDLPTAATSAPAGAPSFLLPYPNGPPGTSSVA